MLKADFCVVVPAFNEEDVIIRSLRSLKETVPNRDIYVVSDGSSDLTAKLARAEKVNVMDLKQNVGKAVALKKLIKSQSLFSRYKYIFFFDADSKLSNNFVSEIQKYIDQNPALIVGTVTSDKHGLISAYRTYEYGLSHRIYKKAQSKIGAITVAPGCASLYHSNILSQLSFENHTLTEDMDLTLQIHYQNSGKIIFASKARVITQDPQNFNDYWKQVLRWNTGMWQNFFLHQSYKLNRKINFELYIMIADSIIWTAFFIFFLFHLNFLVITMAFNWLIIILIGLLIIFLERKWWITKYLIFFPIFPIINLVAFNASFFRFLINRGQTLAWQKVKRYSS